MARKTLTQKDPMVAVAETPGRSGNISEDEIRRRAYEIFLERGATPGDPQNDWFEAEKELFGR